jgi:hypothetical protein
VSDYLKIVYRRALTSSDPALLQLSFDASVLARYRDGGAYQLMRTDSAGRINKPREWSLDLGIAPDGTLHASWGAIAVALPAGDRDHWAAHAVATDSLSENFLRMQMSPSSCFDDGELRSW